MPEIQEMRGGCGLRGEPPIIQGPHRADAFDSYCLGCESDKWDDGKVAEMQDRVGYWMEGTL